MCIKCSETREQSTVLHNLKIFTKIFQDNFFFAEFTRGEEVQMAGASFTPRSRER